MQETARAIDDLGFNATSEDPILPNALLLRSAEAVDAVRNAAQSGYQTTSTASAGYILCSIVRNAFKLHIRNACVLQLMYFAQVQLGGVIYVLFCVVIALILLTCLPLVNFCFQICFDTSVYLVTRGARKPNTAARGGQTAFTKATTARLQRAGVAANRFTPDGQTGPKLFNQLRGRKRNVKTTNADAAPDVPTDSADANKTRVDMSGNSGKGSYYDPISESKYDAFDLSKEEMLSPQQRRALMRQRRGYGVGASVPTGAISSFASSVVSLTRRAMRLGMAEEASTSVPIMITSAIEEHEGTLTAPGTDSDDGSGGSVGASSKGNREGEMPAAYTDLMHKVSMTPMVKLN